MPTPFESATLNLKLFEMRREPVLRAAHGEVFLTFSKIHPFIAEVRAMSGEPDFCRHLEFVVLGAPDAVAIMTRRRAAALAAARARSSHPPSAAD